MKFRILNEIEIEDAMAAHIASEFMEWLETKGYAVAFAGDKDPYDSYVEMGVAWVREVAES